jgi:hypothetical protein
MKPVFPSLALFGALFLASCDDSASVQPSAPAPDSATKVSTTSAPTHKPVCPAQKNPLPDLKAFSCSWTSLEPIYSSTVHLDSLGTLTASRPVFGSGESRLSGYPMETRSICLDSARMVAIRDSLLLPAVIQAPRLVERDPRCADGGHTTFKIERVNQESILMNDQDCHPNTPSPEGYQIAERLARSLFEAVFPSE